MMTKAEAEEAGFAVESYAGGFMLVDYSGNRGKFGAAYTGTDMDWRSQPQVSCPFNSEDEAWAKAGASKVTVDGAQVNPDDRIYCVNGQNQIGNTLAKNVEDPRKGFYSTEALAEAARDGR